MKFDRHRHHRRSIRLPGCDYSHPGEYFVTLCTLGRECLFGDVMGGGVRSGAVLDAFVIMPNHMHGIVIIKGDDERVGATDANVGAQGLAPLQQPPLQRLPKSLGSFVAGFKIAVTKRVNAVRDSPGARVWQRNYYERAIRDDEEPGRALGYIAGNPARWAVDDYFVRS